MSDLDGAALIREVHVYGQSLPVGAEKTGAAPAHRIGTRLLEEAENTRNAQWILRLAVISAVGTRQYYLERGYDAASIILIKNI